MNQPRSYELLDLAWNIAIKAATWMLIVPIAVIALLAGPDWLMPWATGAIGFGAGLGFALTYVSRGFAGEAEDELVTESEEGSDQNRYA